MQPVDRCTCKNCEEKQVERSSTLHHSIQKHSLPELFDRLEALSYEHSCLPENKEFAAEWTELLTLIEQARFKSLLLEHRATQDGVRLSIIF